MQRSPWRSEGSQPHLMLLSPRSQCQKRNPHNFWLWKLAGIVAEWKRGWFLGVPGAPFKGMQHRLTHWLTRSELQCWAGAWKARGTDREDLRCLASEQGWRVSFLPDRSARRSLWLLLALPPPSWHTYQYFFQRKGFKCPNWKSSFQWYTNGWRKDVTYLQWNITQP